MQEKIYRELQLRPLDGMERFVELRDAQTELILANKKYNEAAANVHILFKRLATEICNGKFGHVDTAM